MVPLAQLLDRRPGCSATLLTAAHWRPRAAPRYATTSRPRKPFCVAVHTHVSANCSHDDSNSLVPLVGRWSLGATNDGQLTIIDRRNSRASRASRASQAVEVLFFAVGSVGWSLPSVVSSKSTIDRRTIQNCDYHRVRFIHL